MTTLPTNAPLDPTLSVNEVLRRWPAAVASLNALGIDSCCGGASSLREAADEAGIPLAELLGAIERTIAAEGAR